MPGSCLPAAPWISPSFFRLPERNLTPHEHARAGVLVVLGRGLWILSPRGRVGHAAGCGTANTGGALPGGPAPADDGGLGPPLRSGGARPHPSGHAPLCRPSESVCPPSA